MSQLITLELPDDVFAAIWTEEDEALFVAEEAAFEAEWQQYLVDVQAMQHRPHPTEEEARDHVLRVLKTWSPTYLPHHEALELAMSEEIAEWNLDLD